jgi:hypothetical protein
VEPSTLGTVQVGSWKLRTTLVPSRGAHASDASALEDVGPIRAPILKSGSFRVCAPQRLPSATFSNIEGSSESSSGVLTVPDVLCQFRGGVFPVWVAPAQSKKVPRMTEKVQEYVKEGADWPRAACILDPVRASIVCHGAAQIIEVAEWLLMGEPASALQTFSVCRVKNKFALSRSELVSVCTELFLFGQSLALLFKECALLEVWHCWG